MFVNHSSEIDGNEKDLWGEQWNVEGCSGEQREGRRQGRSAAGEKQSQEPASRPTPENIKIFLLFLLFDLVPS